MVHYVLMCRLEITHLPSASVVQKLYANRLKCQMLLQKNMFAQWMKLVCQFDVNTGVIVAVDKHRVTDLVVDRLIKAPVPSRHLKNPLEISEPRRNVFFLWQLCFILVHLWLGLSVDRSDIQVFRVVSSIAINLNSM